MSVIRSVVAVTVLALGLNALIAAPASAVIPVVDASPAFGWGKNSGALGDGTTNSSNVPVAVSTGGSYPSNYIDISAAGDHSCGIAADGVAYCWGSGAFGRLGTGNTSSTTAPAPVVTTGALPDTYKDIEAGEVFSCGIGSDDSVYCWGRNDEGQLGNGTLTSSSTPVPILAGASPGQFKSLAVGAYHACALTNAGSAYCWGYGSFGQMGNGTTTQRNATPVAVVAGASLGLFFSIAAGDHRTCAVGIDYFAYCWGRGTYGGNGNGVDANASSPVKVGTGPMAPMFTKVAPGGDQTCGLALGGGTAYCWGLNASGQLGNGNNANSNTPVAVSTAGGRPTSYADISAGRDFSCAIASTGSAYCWGLNGGNGSLGTGSFGGTVNEPALVVSNGALANRRVLQIDLGPEFAMVIAGLTTAAPTFDTPVRTADGFTVNVTNYDPAWTWTPTKTAGTVTAGSPSGATLPLTVTGLSANQSSTVTVRASRPGYVSAASPVSASALGAAWTPNFDTPVRTADGFTVNVTNYDASWVWTPQAAAGAVTVGTPSGFTLPLTVTGLAAGQSSIVTVDTSRTGYVDGTAQVTTSALASALTPTFSTPVSTATGFTVDVTNYDASWNWIPAVTSGSVVTGTPSGSTLPVIVTGLTSGASATLTMSTTRAGYAGGSASVTGSATSAQPPSPSPSPVIWPPGAPAAVTATAGDASATVSWAAPEWSGTFAVSGYEVTSSPDGRACTTVTTSCVVEGLTNGTAYTFVVRAVSLAGLGAPSVPSPAVTPSAPPQPTITIVGSRTTVRGKPGFGVTGAITDAARDAVLVPFVRFDGRTSFQPGSARIRPDDSGAFTWSRRGQRGVEVYVETDDGKVQSNAVSIAR